jgi:hypothetical protein
MALYRVVVQGWSKDDAIREMDEGGYHHSSLFRNLDRYVRAANVEALRKQLGITLRPSPDGPTLTASAASAASTASASVAPNSGLAPLSTPAETAATTAVISQNP